MRTRGVTALAILACSGCQAGHSVNLASTLAPRAPAGVHASVASASSCGGGLTGAISATGTTGPLPGVTQFVCASTAIAPPFNGPDAASGGSGQTFSFSLNSTLLPTLNNTMTFFITGNSTGSYDISTLNNYILFGYSLSSGYCTGVTGKINITSLGFGTAVGTFSTSGICDSAGAVHYANVSGSFHIP
jgi:hypothetical protein